MKTVLVTMTSLANGDSHNERIYLHEEHVYGLIVHRVWMFVVMPDGLGSGTNSPDSTKGGTKLSMASTEFVNFHLTHNAHATT